MKSLVHDVLSIFKTQAVEAVLIRAGLSHREKSSLQPIGMTSVSWATSMEELNDAFAMKARDAGAVGYHITNVESHKTSCQGHRILAATATLYNINAKMAYE
ncbi:YdgH/BhsA/McbA family protein [Mangrovibacter yixingensis]|uniref:DUF1471 domain-containing protein n=1 Tax=Mangrovibacter yixingensis TaxID=1529639 RepID=UPI001CFD1DBC|nr:DUF1471 domain-containing protein [Mangrovibacter yixingensis]